MKIAVVYHSETGNTAKMAACVVEGLGSVDGVEARAFSLKEADGDFIKQSQALIIGTPVYAGTMSGQTKIWLDAEAGKLGLGGKLAGAFATANYAHGGLDTAILAVLNHLMVMGMLIYSSGAAKGRPVIHYGPGAVSDNLDSYNDLFKTYGQRMAEKAKELFKI